ncbi:hypothetical protein J0K78_03300 [Halobacillus sp. GSS1]|uniref:protein DpdD n=1 Tax=Halobacillus sp. GSS1 TaxID=2815919 RepID=UPI001A8FE195|nr:protein DpdD [Halobacillus sp. GSS1]MBN9653280.1 hypothetical protein [Halobacillus sp. GSS1]
MNIKMENDVLAQFLTGLLKVNQSNPYDIQIEDNVWTADYLIILKLVERANQGKPTLLPFYRGKKVNWLILANNEQKLLRTIGEINHLLLPYFSKQSTDSKQYFDPESALGKYGSQLYPDGYYMLESSATQQETIFERLGMWLHLDEQRPLIAYEELEVNAFRLRSKFKQAISLKKWDEAYQILIELQKGHFLTDENIKFLSIQLYSSQSKWGKIWDSNDFELLAGLSKIPRRVHSALLHAFYQRVLVDTDIIKDFEQTYTVFKQTRQRLGGLLRSQLGLDEEYLLRVFAYEAAFTNQLEKLERYQQKAEDELTKKLIDFLIKKVNGSEQPQQPEEDKPLIEKAMENYQVEQYEDAYITLLDCETTPEKVALLAGIATMLELDDISAYAYAQFEQLKKQDQELLCNQHATKGNMMYVLLWKKGTSASSAEQEQVQRLSWGQWFKFLLSEDADVDVLEQQLHQLDEQSDSFLFTLKTLEDLSNCIMELAVEQFSHHQKLLLNTAIPMFVSHLMLDKQFPNYKAITVYEYTIELLLIHAKKNSDNTSFILNLMEAVLTLDLEYADKFWNNTKEWFNISPVERLSQKLLETIELFKDFGISNHELLPLWSNWATGLMERFVDEKTTVIQSWVKIGKEIGGDTYLIKSIEDSIMNTEYVDPISTLDNETITIYSLREKAAVRAVDRIKKRNKNIKVRICTDSKLTNEAKSYARNSDLVIIVTTCLSHALFYGISPFIKDNPIYPRSAGETAIVEALESYLENRYDMYGVS